MRIGSFDFSVFASLSKPIVAEVFKRVLHQKISSYFQLEVGVEKEQLDSALKELEEAGLIERKAAYNTPNYLMLDIFLPTVRGLEMQRLIRRQNRL